MNSQDAMGTPDLIERAARVLTVLGVAGRPAYRLLRLAAQARTVASADEVRAAVQAFAPAAGWMQHCSAVRLWGGAWRAEDGPPLAGEFVAGARSLHVRHGSQGWTLLTLTEGEGDEFIAHDTRFESVAAVHGEPVPGHALRYRVYLRRDAELGPRP